MSLYQSSVLKKFQAAQDDAQMQAAFEAYGKYFLDAAVQENIRNSKEEQFQEGFLRELFVNILGYTINPNPDFNLTTELRNIKDARKTDGAILKDGNALAVIELKGADTKDLEKVTEQAFNYKNNQPSCVYVITSNFEKLRFYIQNAVEHVEFNLFTLTYNQFKLLWLFLRKENLLGGIPQKVKEESLLEEEKVTKRLYMDYSSFKSDLWSDMCQNNPEADELELYKKSQKLLDRFLFIFFAEDKGLLPPNSISVIVDDWNRLKDLDEYKPLYSRFQKYFGYLNDGFKGKKYEIHAYNGGLFKPDPLLDDLAITDEVLEKHVLKLTEYDFESEVDTNILGHIFEHSLNDIENVRAQLAGEEVDKSKTKRKKDGVFYTPKYITKYIVDNTLGKLCEEKKQKIGIDEEDFTKERKGRRKETLKKLDALLKEYREWLLQLTICDPACGSGAFLNQVLEFLIVEHRSLDEMESQLLGYLIVFPDVENHILERNIYGVDINEESVEIARLSLWLRTAKKGRKLTSLNDNIKVGNSLIDDPAVAGNLAFNWHEQFPTVFREKEKRAYHITTATHDSRTSERMVEYKVREKRDDGSRPYAQSIWLEPDDELYIKQTVADIVKEDGLNVLAFNICGDHMHMLLVCEEDEVAGIVKKIKGRTSRELHIHKGGREESRGIFDKGFKPLVSPMGDPMDNPLDSPLGKPAIKSSPAEKSVPLWTQKFGCKEIKDHDQLVNTIEYVRNNRLKHNLPPNPNIRSNKGEENQEQFDNKGFKPLVKPLSVGNPLVTSSLVEIIDGFITTVEHAFRTEYKGGFDVVIGNPPWGGSLDPDSSGWLLKKYPIVPSKLKDTYMYFQLLSIKLLINNGFLGLIVPNTWLLINNTDNFRRELLSYEVFEITDHGDGVFDDAIVESASIFMRRRTLKDGPVIAKKYRGQRELANQEIPKSIWLEDEYCRIVLELDLEMHALQSRIEKQAMPFNKSSEIIFGIKPYQVGHGTPAQTQEIVTNRVFHSNRKLDDSWKPLIVGGDITRYNCVFNQDEYIKYGEWLMYKSNEQKILSPKIVLRRTTHDLKAALDLNNYYPQNSIFIITSELNLKYLLAVLNSRLMNRIYKNKCPQEGKVFAEVKPSIIKSLPILEPSISQVIEFEKVVENINDKVFSMDRARRDLLDFLQSKFPIENPSKKLQNWSELTFKGFLAELNKSKVQLSLEKEAEWMQYFNTKKAEANALQTEINRIDRLTCPH